MRARASISILNFDLEVGGAACKYVELAMADKQEEVLLSEFSDDAAAETDAESQLSLNINPPGEGTTWDKKAR